MISTGSVFLWLQAILFPSTLIGIPLIPEAMGFLPAWHIRRMIHERSQANRDE
jgi:hypothetical protein